jgi:glutathione synthase/RimK-type ligase-like ATP-grasp enzyme
MTIKQRIHIGSKWDKTRALLREPQMRSHVPITRRLHAGSLERMLLRHKMVYIKPVCGTYGNGVMKVERRTHADRASFRYQLQRKKRTFRTFSSMYRSILHHKGKRPYLVQKGIRLLTHRGRPFDIRVMVQKDRKHQWEATGMIGRVAHPLKIVTNYHSGGTPTDVRILLQPHLKEKTAEYEKMLAQLGKTAAQVLSKAYPGVNMVGADIGVDTDFQPWIIELNTKPDPYIFKHLRNQAIYRKVLRYARRLRRISARGSKKTYIRKR